MLFSSITFLYFFFPITIVFYYVVPERYKNVVLCLASFFFYAWGEPRYCILLFLYGWIAYVSGCLLDSMKTRKHRQIVLAISILLFGGGLFYFKYAVFVLENLNKIVGDSISVPKILLPIGISFYTFQVISYVVDVYCGKIHPQKRFLAFLTYLSMFPQLIAGPIVRYEEVASEIEQRTLSCEKFARGIRRFVTGLSKKVLLADELGQVVEVIARQQITNPVAYWISAIAFMLQIYFDFSGYSDMAIGMGHMFGFSFPENFAYPFIAKSISEFWRRWHMTLSRFLRDYLYIPLGGNRVSYGRWVINMFIVWGASGIWHGAGWNFLLWGLYFGICLILEKRLTRNNTVKLPSFLQHMYTLFLLVISFVIFAGDSMSSILTTLSGMFSLWRCGEQLPEVLFLIRNYGVLFFVAILASCPFYRRFLVDGRDGSVQAFAVTILENVWYLVCFLLSTAYLVNHTFHPFLYFRF